MKIKNPNAGALTNFEVLDFLVSRGASKDVSRVIARVEPSEYEVYDYLIDTVAGNQTREQVYEFLEKSKEYDLAKAEILNIINLRPCRDVELYPIIEQAEKRYGERLEELGMLIEHTFPSPAQPDSAEAIDDDQKEAAGGEEIDEDGKETADVEQMDEDQKDAADA